MIDVKICEGKRERETKTNGTCTQVYTSRCNEAQIFYMRVLKNIYDKEFFGICTETAKKKFHPERGRERERVNKKARIYTWVAVGWIMLELFRSLIFSIPYSMPSLWYTISISLPVIRYKYTSLSKLWYKMMDINKMLWWWISPERKWNAWKKKTNQMIRNPHVRTE